MEVSRERIDEGIEAVRPLAPAKNRSSWTRVRARGLFRGDLPLQHGHVLSRPPAAEVPQGQGRRPQAVG